MLVLGSDSEPLSPKSTGRSSPTTGAVGALGTCGAGRLLRVSRLVDRRVKEVGEGSTLPVLGAVAHAIANATGVWIKDLPITPEKILDALRARHEAETSVPV